MKSLTRLFALFIAAILCSTFLSACADTPVPPVSDNTTDAAVTDAPVEETPVSDFEYEESEGGITITGYKGSSVDVVIPANISGKPVTSIGYSAFFGKSVQTVTLPGTVTDITEMAFDGCVTLKSVIFKGDAPEKFTASEPLLPYGVSFEICYPDNADGFTTPMWHSYKARPISANLNVFMSGDFECFENENGGITIVKYYGNSQKVEIPSQINGKSVTEIANAAFYENSSIASVVLPDGMISIGDRAFYSCTKLESVVVPISVKNIGAFAFMACKNMENITLSDTLVSLGRYAFSNCTSLSSIKLPGSLKTVEDSSFYNNTALSTVIFGEGIENIGVAAFGYCRKLNGIVLPDSLKIISKDAFGGCSALKDIALNKGLSRIEERAFESNAIESIIVPDTVVEITDLAFNNCSKLKSITFEGDAPSAFASNVKSERANNVDFIVYYNSGAKGFTSPEWCGYDTRAK